MKEGVVLEFLRILHLGFSSPKMSWTFFSPSLPAFPVFLLNVKKPENLNLEARSWVGRTKRMNGFALTNHLSVPLEIQVSYAHGGLPTFLQVAGAPGDEP